MHGIPIFLAKNYKRIPGPILQLQNATDSDHRPRTRLQILFDLAERRYLAYHAHTTDTSSSLLVRLLNVNDDIDMQIL